MGNFNTTETTILEVDLTPYRFMYVALVHTKTTYGIDDCTLPMDILKRGYNRQLSNYNTEYLYGNIKYRTSDGNIQGNASSGCYVSVWGIK